MGLIGTGLGAGLGAAAKIFGGIASSRVMKGVRKSLDEQREKNQNWFDQRYNEDATQRADAQRILTKTEETFRNRNKQAAATAAVMGGTEESIAANKAENAQALADATSKIAVNAEAQKSAIENQYLTTDANIQNQINEIETQRANNIKDAANEAAKTLVSAGSVMPF